MGWLIGWLTEKTERVLFRTQNLTSEWQLRKFSTQSVFWILIVFHQTRRELVSKGKMENFSIILLSLQLLHLSAALFFAILAKKLLKGDDKSKTREISRDDQTVFELAKSIPFVPPKKKSVELMNGDSLDWKETSYEKPTGLRYNLRKKFLAGKQYSSLYGKAVGMQRVRIVFASVSGNIWNRRYTIASKINQIWRSFNCASAMQWPLVTLSYSVSLQNMFG